MANWADVEMAVVLPSRNKDRFLSFFMDKDGNPKRSDGRHIKRCFLDEVHEEKNSHGMSCLRIECQCAWSAYSSFFVSKEEREENKTLIPLLEAMKESEVRRMTFYANEPGIGFEETGRYQEGIDEDIYYDSRDLYRDPYSEFLEEDEADEKTEKQME